ncbi:uncharacterized protein MONOS_4328 [Monocercomonoides exilis]|uniref:uncharacterized protein n=1 Tax=Monocercomonoides exilis TaxID=2049356 RepID=UPI0035594293|nr:hypothetical protein MONOS_4328 [Monocercomonoides exilis]|eukprot:MONOS_4328.1-p1 / transcript=MONOS_4328.1 / gene=MONOS_4328 / organism=Monocercomonoides_exilis_PA203 / gene_product=unspecified product / transcript_product=unspecified product / location=Mono_scaffold00113:117217-117822(-) / protein_length=202 / sequence_SO=supercontig / SO=protein_coding / is_pseudo=false
MGVNEEVTREMKFCVERVDAGSLAIEDFTLSELIVVKVIMEIGVEVEVISVVNVSILNKTMSGEILTSLTVGSHNIQFKKREERNTRSVARLHESTFTNILSGENGTCVVSVDSFGVCVECVMEGCVLTKCVSERSKEGGGVKMCLKSGESELKMRGCSLVMCMCSTVDGRGGVVMIDAVDPKDESVETKIPALGVRLESM